MNVDRLIKAFVKLALLSAFVHLSILSVLFILRPDFSYFNIFSIVGVDQFFPGIEKGGASFTISTVIVLVIYLLFYAKHK